MKFEERITKEDIFKYLTQEEIFEKYLGIKVSLTKKVTNPIRGDRHPTVTFKWFGDNLVMSDYSGWFTGNCIQLVMKINYCTYNKALEIIHRDFNLNQSTRAVIVHNRVVPEIKIFKTYKENLSEYNIKWWEEYKINASILNKYEVYKCREAHIGKYDYYYTDRDPCYNYIIRNLEGEYREKLYFPLRKEHRFLGNVDKNSWFIQGLFQLDYSQKELVITKSLKDVMCLHRFDINSISLNSESTPLYEPVLEYLQSKFDKIYFNMDYDYAGIKMMNKYKKRGFSLLFFKDYNFKDFADYCKLTDEKTIINFIKKIKNENY